jgi:hypothetical protein
MRRSADTRERDLGLTPTSTESAGPATPDLLADDMYTSPTPT